MGRRGRYETHVQPHLDEIRRWIQDMNEGEIAKRLGVGKGTFNEYKRKYPELERALIEGAQGMREELRETMKKKAKGFFYTETKTTIRKDANGNKTTIIEKFEKYAQPDTGALHLLLKNCDPSWHNDDQETINQKNKALKQTDKKIELSEW